MRSGARMLRGGMIGFLWVFWRGQTSLLWISIVGGVYGLKEEYAR